VKPLERSTTLGSGVSEISAPLDDGAVVTPAVAAPLKDETLSRLGDIANVAQFVSFGPGGALPQRFSRVRGYRPDHRFVDAHEAVEKLIGSAASGSVNVRSFRAGASKGGQFTYGLRFRDEVVALLAAHGGEGLYTIVNETVDVEDGGVSGVALGGLLEFAPKDTPRSVEKPGSVAFERDIGLRLLSTVYGFLPDLDYAPYERVEFSIHPLAAGVRQTHTIVWEKEQVDFLPLIPKVAWPNAFSRFIGDKAFGLLVAHLLGLPVPLTTVVGRQVAPFRFGRSTGSGEHWIRTCPVEPVPGKFTTQRGWRDPFELLRQEDATGTGVASILSQEGIRARYSGAALPDSGGGLLVEGVPGFGDEFMLARAAPSTLPATVIRDVRKIGARAEKELGAVRFEWVHDGRGAWVVQLHRATVNVTGTTIFPGEPEHWRSYDPSQGLEELRDLIATIRSGEGIEVAGDIGITSHVGDLLRKAAIPSRLAEQPR
jgi:hypothetical protein